jgi:predicted DNA-binding transcriptional regulator YafY
MPREGLENLDGRHEEGLSKAYSIGSTECVVEVRVPAQSKGHVMQRQWEMLRLVPGHDRPGRTAAEVAAALSMRGYDVTRRTVERDLESLLECMPLEINDSERPQRWRWQKTRGLDVPGMEAAEAMALYIMRDAMTAHLPSCFIDALHTRFSQANKTLAALSRSGAKARWSDRVRVVPSSVLLKPPRIGPKILQALETALLNDIAIEVSYQSLQRSAPTPRILYPRGLLLRGSSLYLIAHQKDAGETALHFAVQRFSSVRLRELEPWPATRFSLDEFLKDGKGQFGEGTRVHLEATISPALGKILRDSPLSDDMQIVDANAALTLRATVRDTWALRTWILGHAENFAVLKPLSLRQDLALRTRAAAAQYD